MNSWIRILIGIGTIGSALTAGIFLNKSLSIEDIQTKLKANNYELLKNENNAIWDEILSNYKIVASKNEKYKFDDFLGVETDSSAREILKGKCKLTLEKKLLEDKDNNLYEKAKKWCIKPLIVSEILIKEGFISLNIDETKTDEDKAIWTKKINEHKDPKNQNKKISNLELSAETDNKKIEEDIKKIKQKCKIIGEAKNHSEDLENSLEKFKNWCSIKNN